MKFTWEYPLFVILYGGGYASVQDPASSQFGPLLAILTNEDEVESFLAEFGILGRPKALQNSREFSWLLQHIRKPVSRVAFNPTSTPNGLESSWIVDIDSLIAEHLQVDYSPWNYPVFAVHRGSGFASIRTAGSPSQPLVAVCLFTTSERAEDYLQAAGETGTIVSFDDLLATRQWLHDLRDQVDAVAIDPTASGDQRRADLCYSLDALLERYLVNHSDG